MLRGRVTALTFAGVRRLAEIESCDLLFAPGGRNATVVINDRAYMDEFERLAAFRQAVLAGFYTDELDEDEAELPSDIASYAELMAAMLESDP